MRIKSRRKKCLNVCGWYALCCTALALSVLCFAPRVFTEVTRSRHSYGGFGMALGAVFFSIIVGITASAAGNLASSIVFLISGNGRKQWLLYLVGLFSLVSPAFAVASVQPPFVERYDVNGTLLAFSFVLAATSFAVLCSIAAWQRLK